MYMAQCNRCLLHFRVLFIMKSQGNMFGVGGNTNFSICVGGNANFSTFRYQPVGIPKAKLWCWGSKPTRGPNANGFASQWNIDFTVMMIMRR